MPPALWNDWQLGTIRLRATLATITAILRRQLQVQLRDDTVEVLHDVTHIPEFVKEKEVRIVCLQETRMRNDTFSHKE